MKFFNKSSQSPRIFPKEDNAFMACILRLNTASRRSSQKALQKLCKAMADMESAQGIRYFNMREDGIVEMSGCVDANMLMYKLGKLEKYVEMLWWQHGQCSSYLYGPDGRFFTGAQSYPGHDAAPYYGRGYAARGMPGDDDGLSRCIIS